jgi:hypothetical protein
MKPISNPKRGVKVFSSAQTAKGIAKPHVVAVIKPMDDLGICDARQKYI